jgi:DNA-binding GntR family transcriptional regulator
MIVTLGDLAVDDRLGGMSRRAAPISITEAAAFAALREHKQSRSLAGTASHALRDAIVRGMLPPGIALRQDRLAEALNMSRVPVRESLRELAGEGLVVLEEHKGATVARLSLDELDELYGIIWSLEDMALRKAVPLITAESLAGMRLALDAMAAERDPVTWYGFNVAFHRELILSSGLTHVLRTIDAIRWNICRYVTGPGLFQRRAGIWLKRNRRLLAACAKRDVAAAVAALEAMRVLSTAEVRRDVELRMKAGEFGETSGIFTQ